MKILRYNLDNLVRQVGIHDVDKLVKEMYKYPGDSYILKPYNLHRELKYMKCSGTHLINYIVLASYRDYYRWYRYGDNTLDAALCPLSDNEIAINPYINRYGKNIHFLLEPSPTGPSGK